MAKNKMHPAQPCFARLGRVHNSVFFAAWTSGSQFLSKNMSKEINEICRKIIYNTNKLQVNSFDTMIKEIQTLKKVE